MEKELKIKVPQGYEIDRQKSTFEKIVFKKVEPCKPTTWEEYCKQTKGCTSYFWNPLGTHIYETTFDGLYSEFLTKERVKQYVALGKLLQLRDYWVGDCSKFNYALLSTKAGGISTVCWSGNVSFSITFPTREMADDFKKCFSDLIKEAYPLV